MPHTSPLLIGAMADDLTGATVLASALSRGGLRITVTVGPPTSTDLLEALWEMMDPRDQRTRAIRS